ncbi:hypothetical protein EVAR_94891_1 [Eumeta japonica]|uniref:Uncharacterized protein n=1 Tax=Eumeta variegata TaxID=151549 RepID=A0A4C1VA43_EUMVA|nr:hypothetical protein EVAR_94891_1 [Eumeta japonica]
MNITFVDRNAYKKMNIYLKSFKSFRSSVAFRSVTFAFALAPYEWGPLSTAVSEFRAEPKAESRTRIGTEIEKDSGSKRSVGPDLGPIAMTKNEIGSVNKTQKNCQKRIGRRLSAWDAAHAQRPNVRLAVRYPVKFGSNLINRLFTALSKSKRACKPPEYRRSPPPMDTREFVGVHQCVAALSGRNRTSDGERSELMKREGGYRAMEGSGPPELSLSGLNI